MADPADLADPEIEKAVASGVAAASNALFYRRTMLPCGCCHYCETDFEEGSTKLFCGRECADDWNNEQQRKRDLGR